MQTFKKWGMPGMKIWPYTVNIRQLQNNIIVFLMRQYKVVFKRMSFGVLHIEVQIPALSLTDVNLSILTYTLNLIFLKNRLRIEIPLIFGCKS